MLMLYRWLLTKLPATMATFIMIAIYSSLILLSIALANVESTGFIYWDE